MTKIDTDLNLARLQHILGKPPKGDGKPEPKITEQTSMFTREDDWDGYAGYGGYGRSSHYNRPVTGTGPVTGYQKYQKKVGVVYPNGMVDTYYLTWESEGWYEFGLSVYPLKDDRILVPSERCAFNYAEPKFNPCVYTATNDYMQARWGRKLDDTDRRWLARHPLSTDGGVPQEYTATCIDQLVQPYGMRVGRIRLRAGSLVLGDSVTAWMQALGVNPFAMLDRKTSNQEAAEKMGMTLDQANALWRCEFSDEPLPCSIIGERGWSSTNGVQTGTFGGHARYLAPRSRAGDWFISVQLETEDRVQHLVPPPNPEYVERKGDPTLIVGSIKRPDSDEPVAVKTGQRWHLPGELPPVTTAAVITPPKTTTTTTPPVAGAPSSSHAATTGWADDETWPNPKVDPVGFDKKVQEKLEAQSEIFQCEFCSSFTKPEDSYANLELCVMCAEEAWADLVCPHCKVKLDVNPPTPTQATDAFEFECARCTETITVPFTPRRKSEDLLVHFCEEVFAQIFAAEHDHLANATDATDITDVLTEPTDDRPSLLLGAGNDDQGDGVDWEFYKPMTD